MKKLLNIISLTLALNFLAAVGGVVWLHQTGRLDHDKAQAIYDLVFNPATQPATQPAKADDTRDPATRPTLALEELLAKRSHFSAAEQVEFIQHTFDAQTAELDHRMRLANDMNATLQDGQRKLDEQRKAFEQDRQKFLAEKKETQRLLTDKGFQDSLQRYTAMPARQVKSIFMTLDDKIMQQYLQAMEPRTAAKIMREFKTDAELQRLQLVMERMRQADPSTRPTTLPAPAPTAGEPPAESAGVYSQAEILFRLA